MTTTVDAEALRLDDLTTRITALENYAQPIMKTAPAITGTAQVGSTLTASNGTWSGSPSSYAYQWKKGGSAISGATSSTYVPVSGDVGSTITVTVSATNANGTGNATSAATTSVTSGMQTETATLLAAMTTQPNSTLAAAYDAFIAGLKTDGLWSIIDAMWVLASHDTAQAWKLNWKAPASNTISVTGTVTVTQYHGAAGDGSTGIMDLNWNASTNGSNFTQNNAGMTIYVRTAASSSNSQGGYAGTNSFNTRTTGSPNKAAWRVNQSSAYTTTSAPPSYTGLFHFERSASGVSSAYYNGASTAFESDTGNTSAAPGNGNFKLGTAASSKNSSEFAFYAVHSSLTSTQRANLASRIATLQTAIGW